MTIQEAERAITACENDITREYSALTTAAKAVGSSAVEAAASTRRTKTLVSLIISLIGLFLMLGGHPFWGVLVIAGGLFVTYNVHESASGPYNKVVNAAKNLDSTINNNATI